MLSDGFDIQSLTSFRVPGPLPVQPSMVPSTHSLILLCPQPEHLESRGLLPDFYTAPVA